MLRLEVTAYSLTFFVQLSAILIMHMYINSARGHELSGHVRADAYNLIFAPYYYAPWPWPCIYVLCMICEKARDIESGAPY